MKIVFSKIITVFLALLVLVSTTSFSIDKHFCGDHLVDLAFFGEAQPCAMEVALDAKYGKDRMQVAGCCSNENTVFKGQDELKLQVDALDFNKVVFVRTSSASYAVPYSDGTVVRPKDTYPPPLLVNDLLVLYEQFLI